MATNVLTDAKVFLGGYDLSADHNRLSWRLNRSVVPCTTFGATAVAKKVGLRNLQGDHSGYWDAGSGEPDTLLQLGTTTDIMTWAASGAAGDIAYSFQPVRSTYEWGGEIDTMNAFTGEFSGSGAAVRGMFLEPGSTSRTSTGTTSAVQVGAATSGQSLYAVLHVIEASGTSPTLDVVIQSDDASGFATPATRVTFSQATAVGAQWATPVAGAITDTYYRVSYTIGGTSPSFKFVVVVGVQ